MAHDHAHLPHQHDSGPPAASWADARQATLHCLTGCAIGEVLGMVIGTAAGLSNGTVVVLSIVLAFFFGYALTIRGVRRAGPAFRRGLPGGMGSETVSLVGVEVVDHAIVVARA